MRAIAKTVFAVLPLLLLAPVAGADLLWDQSTINLAGQALPNSNSPGFNGFIAHSVNDITVPSPGWHVTTITQYHAAFNFNWQNLTQGFVNIQPKTGPLPTAPPVAVQSPMSCALDPVQSAIIQQNVFAIRAIVDINLAPGDYWIGITPTAGAGINGANLQWSAVQVGDPVATYSTNGLPPLNVWQNLRPNLDGCFKLEGDIPTVAVEDQAWGSIKSLYRQ
jgi:hypothetical protein